MSEFMDMYGDRLSEVTDDYNAIRLQRAVDIVGVDVAFEVHSTAHDQAIIKSLPPDQRVFYIDLITSRDPDADEEGATVAEDAYWESIDDFDARTSKIMGKVNGFSLGAVEANSIILRSSQSLRDTRAENLFFTTLEMSRDLKTGEVTFVKQSRMNREKIDSEISDSDRLIMLEVLNRLHEINQTLRPNRQ